MTGGATVPLGNLAMQMGKHPFEVVAPLPFLYGGGYGVDNETGQMVVTVRVANAELRRFAAAALDETAPKSVHEWLGQMRRLADGLGGLE